MQVQLHSFFQSLVNSVKFCQFSIIQLRASKNAFLFPLHLIRYSLQSKALPYLLISMVNECNCTVYLTFINQSYWVSIDVYRLPACSTWWLPCINKWSIHGVRASATMCMRTYVDRYSSQTQCSTSKACSCVLNGNCSISQESVWPALHAVQMHLDRKCCTQRKAVQCKNRSNKVADLLNPMGFCWHEFEVRFKSTLNVGKQHPSKWALKVDHQAHIKDKLMQLFIHFYACTWISDLKRKGRAWEPIRYAAWKSADNMLIEEESWMSSEITSLVSCSYFNS